MSGLLRLFVLLSCVLLSTAAVDEVHAPDDGHDHHIEIVDGVPVIVDVEPAENATTIKGVVNVAATIDAYQQALGFHSQSDLTALLQFFVNVDENLLKHPDENISVAHYGADSLMGMGRCSGGFIPHGHIFLDCKGLSKYIGSAINISGTTVSPFGTWSGTLPRKDTGWVAGVTAAAVTFMNRGTHDEVGEAALQGALHAGAPQEQATAIAALAQTANQLTEHPAESDSALAGNASVDPSAPLGSEEPRTSADVHAALAKLHHAHVLSWHLSGGDPTGADDALDRVSQACCHGKCGAGANDCRAGCNFWHWTDHLFTDFIANGLTTRMQKQKARYDMYCTHAAQWNIHEAREFSRGHFGNSISFWRRHLILVVDAPECQRGVELFGQCAHIDDILPAFNASAITQAATAVLASEAAGQVLTDYATGQVLGARSTVFTAHSSGN